MFLIKLKKEEEIFIEETDRLKAIRFNFYSTNFLKLNFLVVILFSYAKEVESITNF